MKTYIIYKDGEQMAKFEHQNTDFEPFKFLLAGRYEPFGLTALEAMACGTTPIVTEEAFIS